MQELLDAGPEEFARDVQEIDRNLRAEIRRLQDTRERLARLAAGEHLALPPNVVDYLDRQRALGVTEPYIEMERASWIMIAAQLPHLIDSVIAKKHEELNNPDMVRALPPCGRCTRLVGRRSADRQMHSSPARRPSPTTSTDRSESPRAYPS